MVGRVKDILIAPAHLSQGFDVRLFYLIYKTGVNHMISNAEIFRFLF